MKITVCYNNIIEKFLISDTENTNLGYGYITCILVY